MKKMLVHLNTFIMFILTVLFIFFIEFEKEIRPNNIIVSLENMNYYQKAYSSILTNIDDYVVNNNLKEEIINFYTYDKIKSDVNLIVKGNSLNYYYDIKQIVSKYGKDDEVINKYSNDINELIKNNIFMADEYHFLNKFYLNIYDCLYLVIIFIIIELVLFLINYFLCKNLVFVNNLILASSIFIGLPKLFLTFSGVINNFTYGNKYFSELIIFLINNFTNDLFIYAVTGITIVICLNDFAKKYYK